MIFITRYIYIYNHRLFKMGNFNPTFVKNYKLKNSIYTGQVKNYTMKEIKEMKISLTERNEKYLNSYGYILLIEGYGKKEIMNGNIYEGKFIKGMFCGYGTFTFSDGKICEGIFYGDCYDTNFNLDGIYNNGKGNIFKGNLIYKDNTLLLQGMGSVKTNNGIYYGNFVNGKLNGIGHHENDKYILISNFKENKFDPTYLSVYIFPNGKRKFIYRKRRENKFN